MDAKAIVEALLVEFGVGTEWRSMSEADSFTILSVFLEIEKRVGISLPPTELVPTNFASVETVLEMIARAKA